MIVKLKGAGVHEVHDWYNDVGWKVFWKDESFFDLLAGFFQHVEVVYGDEQAQNSVLSIGIVNVYLYMRSAQRGAP